MVDSKDDELVKALFEAFSLTWEMYQDAVNNNIQNIIRLCYSTCMKKKKEKLYKIKQLTACKIVKLCLKKKLFSKDICIIFSAVTYPKNLKLAHQLAITTRPDFNLSYEAYKRRLLRCLNLIQHTTIPRTTITELKTMIKVDSPALMHSSSTTITAHYLISKLPCYIKAPALDNYRQYAIKEVLSRFG